MELETRTFVLNYRHDETRHLSGIDGSCGGELALVDVRSRAWCWFCVSRREGWVDRVWSNQPRGLNCRGAFWGSNRALDKRSFIGRWLEFWSKARFVLDFRFVDETLGTSSWGRRLELACAECPHASLECRVGYCLVTGACIHDRFVCEIHSKVWVSGVLRTYYVILSFVLFWL